MAWGDPASPPRALDRRSRGPTASSVLPRSRAVREARVKRPERVSARRTGGRGPRRSPRTPLHRARVGGRAARASSRARRERRRPEAMRRARVPHHGAPPGSVSSSPVGEDRPTRTPAVRRPTPDHGRVAGSGAVEGEDHGGLPQEVDEVRCREQPPETGETFHEQPACRAGVSRPPGHEGSGGSQGEVGPTGVVTEVVLEEGEEHDVGPEGGLGARERTERVVGSLGGDPGVDDLTGGSERSASCRRLQ